MGLFSRRSLKSRGDKTSVHFIAEPQTAELLMRTIFSVNQLSVYGAVAHCETVKLCQQLNLYHALPDTPGHLSPWRLGAG